MRIMVNIWQSEGKMVIVHSVIHGFLSPSTACIYRAIAAEFPRNLHVLGLRSMGGCEGYKGNCWRKYE